MQLVKSKELFIDKLKYKYVMVCGNGKMVELLYWIKEWVLTQDEMDVDYVGDMASSEGLSPYFLEKVWSSMLY